MKGWTCTASTGCIEAPNNTYDNDDDDDDDDNNNTGKQ